MRKLNDNGSIVPLVVFFLVIGIAGLLIGILSVIVGAVSNSDNNINSLFTTLWAAIAVIVLIVIGYWTMVKGQRSG